MLTKQEIVQEMRGWSGKEIDVIQVFSGRFVNANVAIRLRKTTRIARKGEV